LVEKFKIYVGVDNMEIQDLLNRYEGYMDDEDLIPVRLG